MRITNLDIVPDPLNSAKAKDESKPSVTAVILAFNEAIHIERCITRAWPAAQRIVVVDSFSTDDTVDIARRCGAEILQRAWKNHADQFQWALDTIQFDTDWIMRIDCDEYLEDGLIDEIKTGLASLPADVSGVDFKRKVIFRGRFIRWGGYYTTHLTLLWRTGMGRMEQRWMDERIALASGRVVDFRGGDTVDENLNDIGWWTAKHNGYATLQMVDFINRKYGLFPIDTGVDQGAVSRTRWRRFLRNGVYGRAPLYLRAVLYFLQRYFLRLGFLDGREGFVWHFLHGFWFFVLMDAKIEEAEIFIRAHGVEAFRQRLKDHYKVDV
jgi:glycosyltransferase involved in cell wall biosynthesis